MKKLTDARYLLMLAVVAVSYFGAVPGAIADDYRIARPQTQSGAEISCCQKTEKISLNANEFNPSMKSDCGIMSGFKRWQERYASPVFCPVDICHGSCSAYDDACLLAGSQPVLSYTGTLQNFVLAGCGGACRQSSSEHSGATSASLKIAPANVSEPGSSCCH